MTHVDAYPETVQVHRPGSPIVPTTTLKREGGERLNWENPILRGLALCFPFDHDERPNVTTSQARELVSPESNQISVAGSMLQLRDTFGPYWALGTSTAYCFDPFIPSFDPSSDISILLIGDFSAQEMVSATKRTTFELANVSGSGYLGMTSNVVFFNPRRHIEISGTSQSFSFTDSTDWNNTINGHHRILIRTREEDTASGFGRLNGLFGDGRYLRSLNPSVVPSSTLNWMTLNGKWNGSFFGNDIGNDWRFIAIWKRILSDEESRRLVRGDYIREFFRRDDIPSPDVIERRLPCPSLPVGTAETHPVRMTGADAGVVIVGASADMKAIRIHEHVVELVLEHWTDYELNQLREVWEDGAAMVKPFWFRVPGESVDRRFVFDGPELMTTFYTAVAKRASLRLRDVTPPDLMV